MPRLSRTMSALLLVAIVATPVVLASPLGQRQDRRSAILASVPSQPLARLWRRLVRAWEKNGWQTDPNGYSSEPPAFPTPPEPNGVQTKNGIQIDPSGSTVQSPPPVVVDSSNGAMAYPHG